MASVSPSDKWREKYTAELLTDLENLLDSSLHTDATICCGGRQWRAHRVILSLRCPFFAKALNSSFRESSGTIELQDDDQNAVKSLLKFIYTGSYGIKDRVADAPTTDHVLEMVRHDIEMLTMGDKYRMPALIELAAANINDEVGTIAHTPDFIDLISKIWDTNIEGTQCIRNNILTHYFDYPGDLVNAAGGDIASRMTEQPEFLADVLKMYGTRKEVSKKGTEHHCKKCHLDFWTFKNDTPMNCCPRCKSTHIGASNSCCVWGLWAGSDDEGGWGTG